MFFKVPEKKIVYTPETEDAGAYTTRLDEMYARFARLYDLAVKLLPLWKTWIKAALPHMEGPRVLEASFGTGYLLMQYADRFETHGIDYNERMVQVARRNLRRKRMKAGLVRGNAEALPYPDECFDTVVNTMAFTGYADGARAMAEFRRVLKPGGRLVIVDFEYPRNRNRFGFWLVKLMEAAGDTIRPIGAILDARGFTFAETEIGGFGAVHLYVARKA